MNVSYKLSINLMLIRLKLLKLYVACTIKLLL